MTRTIIFVSLLVCMLSLICIYILSIRVSSPIRELIVKMEKTNLDNIDYNAPFVYSLSGRIPRSLLRNFVRKVIGYETRNTINFFEEKCPVACRGVFYSNDEFTMLYETYNKLLKRLKTAIDQEKEASLLHLQAEFNTLQTQINPHFIYNILNVISHRGVLNGDETICTICEKIASMLRYSSGTSRRMVTIREELDYVQHYLYLLKTRFRQKLDYHVQADLPGLKQMIPKITLQPIIENSINHGRKEEGGIMDISIRGWTDDERWYIEVADNGPGFSPGKKADLEQKMENIRNQIRAGNWNPGLDIGGMGLLSIYARFFIMFGDGAIFLLSNGAGGGAVVTIGAARAACGV
jgi:two-component system sensor histidine kinase YesM